MATQSDNMMTTDELGAYLKISKSMLYKPAQEGKLPGRKIGKRWGFDKEGIDEWLKQHPEKGERSTFPRSSPDG